MDTPCLIQQVASRPLSTPRPRSKAVLRTCVIGCCAKVLAAQLARNCSRPFVAGSSETACRYGERLRGCGPCTHNGVATLTPGWRDRNVIQPERRQRGDAYEQELQNSPFAYLLDTAGNSSKGRQEVARLRRRLT